MKTLINRVAYKLISDGVSFIFYADECIIFFAPEYYAKYLNKWMGQVVAECDVETN